MNELLKRRRLTHKDIEKAGIVVFHEECKLEKYDLDHISCGYQASIDCKSCVFSGSGGSLDPRIYLNQDDESEDNEIDWKAHKRYSCVLDF